jgi:hypothetical protein
MEISSEKRKKDEKKWSSPRNLETVSKGVTAYWHSSKKYFFF